MSDIRFVNQLGDAVELAAERRIAARRHRLRRLVAGVVGAALLGTGVATAATILGHSERLAAGTVYCYDTANLDGGATGLLPGARTPVAACAAETGRSGPHVACDDRDGAIAVVPGRGAAMCRRLGLVALPTGYGTAHQRMVTLSRDVAALEASAKCIPPAELATRVQALLDRSGWAGWHTWLRLDVSDGPCGSVSMLNGDGSRSIEPALDVEGHRVMVFGDPAR